jgi:hypothetical protein
LSRGRKSNAGLKGAKPFNHYVTGPVSKATYPTENVSGIPVENHWYHKGLKTSGFPLENQWNTTLFTIINITGIPVVYH